MVDNPGQFSFHIPVDPSECLLEQLASCFGIKRTQSRAKIGVHIESPVEVTSGALEVPPRMSRAMQSKVSNSHDELELGLF